MQTVIELADHLRELLRRNLSWVYLASFLLTLYIGLSFGLGWYALSIVGFCLLMGFIMWDEYLYAIRRVESQLYGQPLDFYKLEGKKPPKLRFVLDKRKHGNTNK